MQVGFSQRRPDPMSARSACVALRHLAASSQRPAEVRLRPAYAALVGAIVGPGPGNAPDDGWYLTINCSADPVKYVDL